jgi:hypothetical protein
MNKFQELAESLSNTQRNVINHAVTDMENVTEGQFITVQEPSLGESLRVVGGEMWDALTPAFSLGAEELSRALFNGTGYVFHGDTIPEQMQHHHEEHEREM